MIKFRLANYWNPLGFMFRSSGVLTILLVLGFCTETFSKTSPEKFPHPIFIPFEHNCTGKKGRKLSNEAISQILQAHSTWLESPTAPDADRANFCKADLSDAGVSKAMLAGANFKEVKLQDVNLQKANLTRANFNKAQLHAVNLDDAMLHLANFQKAMFHNVSLQDAMLYQTNLKGADLRKVKGLTQNQINMACLNKHTKLSPGLSHPKPCS